MGKIVLTVLGLNQHFSGGLGGRSQGCLWSHTSFRWTKQAAVPGGNQPCTPPGPPVCVLQVHKALWVALVTPSSSQCPRQSCGWRPQLDHKRLPQASFSQQKKQPKQSLIQCHHRFILTILTKQLQNTLVCFKWLQHWQPIKHYLLQIIIYN